MAALGELEEVQEELVLCASKGTSPPADKLIKFLRLIRELKLRDSESTARYGSLVLRKYKRLLSEEELWLLHEQVAVAALDCSAIPFAASLIRAVAKKFPDSMRTKRLQGMYYEASGAFDRALELYSKTWDENPDCDIMAKRLVALEKSRGNTQAAVEALRKYLEVWCNDREAWEELADMYLELLMYRQALFCYEELLMFAPMHHNYLVRYADILYTLGGNNNLRLARCYYAKAVEASAGHNARALYGVLACCSAITDKVAVQDSRTRAQVELPDLSAQALVRLYRKYAPSRVPLVIAALEQAGQA